MSVRVAIRKTFWYVFGSSDRDRLTTTVQQTRIDFNKRSGRTETESPLQAWESAVLAHLAHAEACVRNCALEDGWASVQAAQRELTMSQKDDQAALHRLGLILLREADTDKIGGWRARTMHDLLCGEDWELKGDLGVEDVVAAMALRDDKYNTTFRRIDLRRRHLTDLLLILLVAMAALVALSFSGEVADYLPPPYVLLLAGLCGVLGACASVAQRMMTSRIDARIPEQVLGSFVIWMRPAVGAAAAIATVILLSGKLVTFAGSDSVLAPFALAFVAGYSERFILGAVNKASGEIAG
jgi:hypothetical protein